MGAYVSFYEIVVVLMKIDVQDVEIEARLFNSRDDVAQANW